jgi:hypothetical protein
MPHLVECHALVLPDAALARFPDAGSPRYVTADRRVRARAGRGLTDLDGTAPPG